MKFFVMLSLSNGNPTPLLNGTDDDDPEIFETREDAERAAHNNPLGQTFRWEVYEW
jgi:hypothetical protein